MICRQWCYYMYLSKSKWKLEAIPIPIFLISNNVKPYASVGRKSCYCSSSTASQNVSIMAQLSTFKTMSCGFSNECFIYSLAGIIYIWIPCCRYYMVTSCSVLSSVLSLLYGHVLLCFVIRVVDTIWSRHTLFCHSCCRCYIVTYCPFCHPCCRCCMVKSCSVLSSVLLMLYGHVLLWFVIHSVDTLWSLRTLFCNMCCRCYMVTACSVCFGLYIPDLQFYLVFTSKRVQ